MTTVKEQEGHYLATFTKLESGLNEHAPAWLPKLRHAAMESFAELGFPTTHDEEWIYTNVAPLAVHPLCSGARQADGGTSAARLSACRWPIWVAAA